MIDLVRWMGPGTGVWWSQASAEPTPLVHALLEQADAIGAVRAFCGMSWDERLATALPGSVSLSSYGAMGVLRTLGDRLDVVPANYSALSRLFAERLLPSDVGLVQVSPPDADGRCSFGVGADWAVDAALATPVLIAEVNERMPPTSGASRLPLARFAAVVHTDRPLLELPQRTPDDTERAIAHNVAELVDDGDTIQFGVGSLPSAVLDCLSGHARLGVHSGMITDAVVTLVDKGVITGEAKEIDRGVIVTGAALGTTELYARVPDLPAVFRPPSYTHAGAVLGQLRSLVSINSALEVDLSGQIGAEVRRGDYVGGVGGQLDFSHAAATGGGRSVIALRSTSGGTSTIKPVLEGGAVTTGRADVDVVVTEHGAAWLRGATISERATRLIAIAAPEFRESLEAGHE